jgi:hypothetical protein
LRFERDTTIDQLCPLREVRVGEKFEKFVVLQFKFAISHLERIFRRRVPPRNTLASGNGATAHRDDIHFVCPASDSGVDAGSLLCLYGTDGDGRCIINRDSMCHCMVGLHEGLCDCGDQLNSSHRSRHNTPRLCSRRPHECTYGLESLKLEGWKSTKLVRTTDCEDITRCDVLSRRANTARAGKPSQREEA